MSRPTVIGGQFHAGKNFRCGENVTIVTSEGCTVGDNCTLADFTWIEGRRVVIGDHLYVAKHWGRRLEIGLNRRGAEDAVLTVGARCTLHDNRIDLTRPVTLGDDVGLSPEVVVYTHGYWMSVLDGHPRHFAPVVVGCSSIIGFRSTLLPGARVPTHSVVGAGAVVTGDLGAARCVYAGVPAKFVRTIPLPSEVTEGERKLMFVEMASNYRGPGKFVWDYPHVEGEGVRLDVLQRTLTGEESPATDALRWHLFTWGVRIYTDRLFGGA